MYPSFQIRKVRHEEAEATCPEHQYQWVWRSHVHYNITSAHRTE